MVIKAASSTIFWVFGMTRRGIEPRSPGPLANTLTIMPMSIHFVWTRTFTVTINRLMNLKGMLTRRGYLMPKVLEITFIECLFHFFLLFCVVVFQDFVFDFEVVFFSNRKWKILKQMYLSHKWDSNSYNHSPS